MPVLPSYRNQSIDLICKSIDWFLYESNTGIQWVKASEEAELHILHEKQVIFRKSLLKATYICKYFFKVNHLYSYSHLIIHKFRKKCFWNIWKLPA